MKIFIKYFTFALCALLFVDHSHGQRPDDVLATSTGVSYKVDSLTPDARKLYLEQRKALADARTRLLSEMIAERLLEIEAGARKTTPEKLVEAEAAKAAQPTAAEIQRVYDANRERVAGATLDQLRPQIVEFLRADAGQKAVDAFLESLRTKHRVTLGRDVNTVGLPASEPLATIGTHVITLGAFETANRFRLHEVEMHIFEQVRGDLESSILSALAAQEAKARNMDLSGFIAAEITDKLRLFTQEERTVVEADLMRSLFAKYNVKFVLPEPKPIVQNISVDDDPSVGNASAPVTVVMFTDFQCSGCARTHPAVKQAVAEYGDKVRFVVRDFPLETIHKDAFNAALAAGAARAQNKFAEYTEILYRNQEALDRASLVRYAAELGLNVKQFELDFSDAKTAAEVRKDQADGRAYGITGTPAVFVNGVKVHRLSLPGFRVAIDRALKK